jgi:hypothetical protein
MNDFPIGVTILIGVVLLGAMITASAIVIAVLLG